VIGGDKNFRAYIGTFEGVLVDLAGRSYYPVLAVRDTFTLKRVGDSVMGGSSKF
jgi:hypothetical protein